MYGSHLSVAGGLHLALLEAQRLGMQCVQVFTKNQRQWNAKPLAPPEVGLWREHLKTTGLQSTVSHDSYLINLAAPDGPTRDKSIAAFRDEIERCEMLGIPWLVTHPGAHLGQGEEEGLRRIVAALDKLHTELPGYKTVTCLEVTAGQGSTLGHRLEHLAWIIEHAHEPDRLAVCLDTAHLLAAGYDLTSAAGAKGVIDEIDHVLGLDRVKVLHLNDSKVPLGKRVDRHEHIGRGFVDAGAWEVLLRHPAFQGTPKILETPKGKDEKGRDWDTVNLDVLYMFATPGSPKTAARKAPAKSAKKKAKKRPTTAAAPRRSGRARRSASAGGRARS
ncbi:MAG: deoxyribonuclease IV [Phycisphaeraceae bacterium]|nr:deoxyribonuclease IV [Phycisphaeraceae bacterium]